MTVLFEGPDISAVNMCPNGILLIPERHYSAMPLVINRTRETLSEGRSATQRSKVRFSITAEGSVL